MNTVVNHCANKAPNSGHSSKPVACPLWVIRDLAAQGQRAYLPAVTPIADKDGRGRIVR